MADDARPMDRLDEPDRSAIVQQLKVRESVWRKVADCYRAMRLMPEPGGDDPDAKLRIAELDKGIANAEAKARQIAKEIAGWEQPC